MGVLSRRTLLRSSLFLASGGLSADALRAFQHTHQEVAAGTAKLEHFDPHTAAEIEAMAAEIIPTDDTPGAQEAGVIYCIDRALMTFDQEKRPLYRDGLAAAQSKREQMFPQSKSIAGLNSAQRISLLKAIESTEFFETVREHVVIGFLSNPSWGGNRDKVGWKLIGFEDSYSFQPPFGYYDAHKDEL